MDTTGKLGRGGERLLPYSVRLLKITFSHWLEDKAPQLGAALAYYTVFSLAGSAYGAAGSLITMLIWVYYAAQILLFGAEFTRVYAQERGRGVRPAKHAVRFDRKEIELPPLSDRGDK